jgi:hypothetical protein
MKSSFLIISKMCFQNPHTKPMVLVYFNHPLFRQLKSLGEIEASLRGDIGSVHSLRTAKLCIKGLRAMMNRE